MVWRILKDKQTVCENNKTLLLYLMNKNDISLHFLEIIKFEQL